MWSQLLDNIVVTLILKQHACTRLSNKTLASESV